MDAERLKAIAHQMQTQDNSCTVDPIFVVMENVKSSPILEGYNYDVSSWYNHETCEECSLEEVAEDIGLTVQDFEDDEYEFREKAGKHAYGFYYQEYHHRAVNAHFTREAAEEHLKINGHNLHEPFVYVLSLWRCQEMIDLRNWLMSGEAARILEENAELIKNIRYAARHMHCPNEHPEGGYLNCISCEDKECTNRLIANRLMDFAGADQAVKEDKPCS